MAPATTPTGSGVIVSLGVNTGTAGAFVVNGGALGTPVSGTVTNLTGTASININGTVGATTANTGAFTTLSASSTVSGTGFSTYLASPPAIGSTAAAAITGTTITANTAFAGPHNGTVGATTPSTGAFTTLSASSTVSGTGFSTYLASPPAIGGTAAAAGTFTTLTATTNISSTRINPRALALSANSATPAINSDTYDIVVITGQTAAITSFTTNLTGTPVNGQKLWVSITGTAAVAITWGASFEASTVALPTTTVTTARLDVGFVWNVATTKWRCVGVA